MLEGDQEVPEGITEARVGAPETTEVCDGVSLGGEESAEVLETLGSTTSNLAEDWLQAFHLWGGDPRPSTLAP